MKKYGLKLLWLLLTVLLAAAWWGWQEGGITSALDAIGQLHQRALAG